MFGYDFSPILVPTWEILCSEKTLTYRLLSDVMKFLWLLNSTVNEVDIMVHFTFNLIFTDSVLWFSSLYHGANNTSRPETFRRTLKTAEAWCLQQIMPKGSEGDPMLRQTAGRPLKQQTIRTGLRGECSYLSGEWPSPGCFLPNEPDFRGSNPGKFPGGPVLRILGFHY